MKGLNKAAEEKIIKTMAAAEKNNMSVYYADKKEDVLPIVRSLINKGDKITVGGSMSLFETGVIDLLKSGDYVYYDRYEEGLTPEKIREIYVKAFDCDVYFSSTNAITVNGELYNTDGNGNRVAAMIYGPKSVILIVGKNKIVENIDEAVLRMKTVAAPKNCMRLNCKTYCAERGECVSLLKENPYLCDGCGTDGRICCDYTVMAHQRHKNRIKIVFVGEDVGY